MKNRGWDGYFIANKLKDVLSPETKYHKEIFKKGLEDIETTRKSFVAMRATLNGNDHDVGRSKMGSEK